MVQSINTQKGIDLNLQKYMPGLNIIMETIMYRSTLYTISNVFSNEEYLM